MRAPAVGILWLLLVSLVLAVDATVDGTTLIVNQEPIYRVRTSQGTMSAFQRAQAMANILIAVGNSATITAKEDEENERWRVTAGERGLFTFTEAEVAAAGESGEALAKRMAQKLRQAVALPLVTLAESEITLPEDGTVELDFRGSRARKALLNYNSSVIDVRTALGKLVVEAKGIGFTQISMKNGPLDRTLDVLVLPYAARFPQEVYAEVVGQPAHRDIILMAAQTALVTQLAMPETAQVDVLDFNATDLAPGAGTTLRVPVRVQAPGHYTSDGQVAVVVRNRGAGFERESVLWTSNAPENVREPERLIRETLQQGQPARFLFHHRNAVTTPLGVQFVLANPSPVPAQVLVLPGEGEPSRNPTLAGYEAGDEFLRAYQTRSAHVVTIPPETYVPVASRRLQYDETASGLLSFELLEGGPEELVLVGDVLRPGYINPALRSLADPEAPWSRVRPVPIGDIDLEQEPLEAEHRYPSPFRQEQFRYEVGGRFAFIRVGQEAIPNENDNRILYGNFGVIYEVTGEIHNPTDETVEVDLVFESSAGYTGALMLLDGEFVKVPLLQPKDEFVVRTYRVRPGGTQNVYFETVPLSGASYPVTITVRASN
jgi:hypothetical protein